MKQVTAIVIVSALHCEVKAILDALKMRKLYAKPFDLYVCDDFNGFGKLYVLVGGIGKLNTAAAVGWCGALLQDQQTAWLNLGIAGHGSKEVGSAFTIGRSDDSVFSRAYFPPQVAKRQFPLDACLCVAEPTSNYPESGGVDMESSAFYKVALRFSFPELIQSVKVVSDNPSEPVDQLNTHKIQNLMLTQLNGLLNFAKQLAQLASTLARSTDEIVIPETLRCSHSQRRIIKDQLKRLLRFSDLSEIDQLRATVNESVRAKELVSILQSRLDKIVPSIDTSGGRHG